MVVTSLPGRMSANVSACGPLAERPSYSAEHRDLNTGPLTIGIAVALTLVAGPLWLGVTGLMQARRVSAAAVPPPATPWNWTLTINSALLYALAFNLTFFIQELFLVLPKALTPGLRPTLFHNNHTWQGDNPLANLLQGTGALAIAAGCGKAVGQWWWTMRRSPSSAVWSSVFVRLAASALHLHDLIHGQHVVVHVDHDP
jgi:hypothetical protein